MELHIYTITSTGAFGHQGDNHRGGRTSVRVRGQFSWFFGLCHFIYSPAGNLSWFIHAGCGGLSLVFECCGFPDQGVAWWFVRWVHVGAFCFYRQPLRRETRRAGPWDAAHAAADHFMEARALAAALPPLGSFFFLWLPWLPAEQTTKGVFSGRSLPQFPMSIHGRVTDSPVSEPTPFPRPCAAATLLPLEQREQTNQSSTDR